MTSLPTNFDRIDSAPEGRDWVERLFDEDGPLAPPYPWHLRDKRVIFEYVASLGHEEREWVVALYVDHDLNLLSVEVLGVGDVDYCDVDANQLLRRGMAIEAAGFYLVHNHPSGIVEPSSADIRLTNKLRHVSELLDMILIEHFVVGREGWSSILWDGGKRHSYIDLIEKGHRPE